MYQQAAWIISIILILFVIFVFLYVVAHSGRRTDYEPIQRKGYRIRNVWFLAVIAAMGLATFYTLRDLPFEKPAHAADSTVVQVKARQFGFVLSQNEFRVGEPIAFQVTSEDVNHGVGIYDERMELLAQTQAMPKYTNTIYYTFDKPGTYQVLCLEYCGIGHHVMVATITVAPAEEGKGN